MRTFVLAAAAGCILTASPAFAGILAYATNSTQTLEVFADFQFHQLAAMTLSFRTAYPNEPVKITLSASCRYIAFRNFENELQLGPKVDGIDAQPYPTTFCTEQGTDQSNSHYGSTRVMFLMVPKVGAHQLTVFGRTGQIPGDEWQIKGFSVSVEN